tara:strand:+ start:26 stop:394 length:369 start_codon:yes stop_codon:yes gene_type:complete
MNKLNTTLSYIDDIETWVIDLDGYNSGKRMIDIKDETQAKELFDFIKKQQHETDTVQGLWCVDKNPECFFKKALQGLCGIASNPENYDYDCSELVEIDQAIDAITSWCKISFQLKGKNNENK